MGMPNIPPRFNTSVNVEHNDIIDLLLISIALEELSLAHILNAEGEIIQTFLDNENCHEHCHHSTSKHCSHNSCRPCSFPPSRQELLKLNRSVTDILKYVSNKEKTLQEKLENIIEYDEFYPKPSKFKCHK